MVFGFSKKKKQYQLPPPADDEEYQLLPPSLDAPRDDDERSYYSHDFHQESSAQQTNEQSSLESLLFSGTTLVAAGMNFTLADMHLVGEPTRNIVAGHGLDFIYSFQIERVILPIGIVYFSEEFSRDAPKDYRIRCMIHMALRETDIGMGSSEGYRGHRWNREREEFFKLLGSHFKSEVSGMELRIYHSHKHIPRQVVREMKERPWLLEE